MKTTSGIEDQLKEVNKTLKEISATLTRVVSGQKNQQLETKASTRAVLELINSIKESPVNPLSNAVPLINPATDCEGLAALLIDKEVVVSKL